MPTGPSPERDQIVLKEKLRLIKKKDTTKREDVITNNVTGKTDVETQKPTGSNWGRTTEKPLNVKGGTHVRPP